MSIVFCDKRLSEEGAPLSGVWTYLAVLIVHEVLQVH